MDSHVKAQQIEAELVALLYKQAPPAFVATILNAGIIICVLWSQVPPSLLITWLVLIGAITACRFGLARRYRRTPLVADQAVYWRTRFIVGTGAAGAVWGAAAIFLFPSASIVHQVFLVFMLGGVAAGAVATLSSVMPAFFAFFLPITLPITVRLFFEGSAVQIAMGFPLLAFVGMLLMTARQFHSSLTTSFNLRLDNLDLVESLSFANKQAEGSNQQLIESNQALSRAILETKTSEERFRSLCAASPMAIFQADREGNVSYTNLRWQEITGLTLEETFGLGSLHTVHFEDRQGVFAEWKASIAAGREFATELRFVRPTGDVRWVYIQAAPIRTDDGTVKEYVGGAIDITERRAVDQMKDEFVSVVSHELRTPLTAIRGSLGLLASGRFGILQEKGRRMMEIAVQNTDRLVQLINDILDIERMQSGQATMVKVACDAAELMAQTVEVMQAIAGKAGVTLSVQPQSIGLWADPDRLIQTLANLLSNAIKFSPPGSQVWLTVEHQNDHALFQIKDQGRGIPADKIESIFERFQQVNASDSRDKGGTGLGLAICRSIVQQHGGRIWVESTPGTGSTFFFTLPLE